jgi:hypothetical protein
MNCQICGRLITIEGEKTLCLSCLDDFEASYEPHREYRNMIERILTEQRIRARMPNFGLKIRKQAGQ